MAKTNFNYVSQQKKILGSDIVTEYVPSVHSFIYLYVSSFLKKLRCLLVFDIKRPFKPKYK